MTVHYTGWLENGTKFDSSVDRGQPFVFPLGDGRVITGRDEGVATMKVGGKRKLIIPLWPTIMWTSSSAPISSGLTLAVAPLAEAHGKILWNHGGASDAIFQGSWRHLVSVPSPGSDYLKALPLLVRSQDPSVARISVVYAKTGSFAAHLARGVPDGAKAAGLDVIRLIPFDSPIRDARALLREALAAEPDLLVGAGSFQDDKVVISR